MHACTYVCIYARMHIYIYHQPSSGSGACSVCTHLWGHRLSAVAALQTPRLRLHRQAAPQLTQGAHPLQKYRKECMRCSCLYANMHVFIIWNICQQHNCLIIIIEIIIIKNHWHTIANKEFTLEITYRHQIHHQDLGVPQHHHYQRPMYKFDTTMHINRDALVICDIHWLQLRGVLSGMPCSYFTIGLWRWIFTWPFLLFKGQVINTAMAQRLLIPGRSACTNNIMQS